MYLKNYLIFLCLGFCIEGISQQVSLPFNNRDISYEGRILYRSNCAVLIWPGTSLTIRFRGTGMKAVFKELDTANYYNIILDSVFNREIHFDTIRKSYTLATGLPDRIHTLQIFKRTGWEKGKTLFYGFDPVQHTVWLSPPVKPKRKMEFFGNSITCGYAIEDLAGDSPHGYYENNYNSYAAITARYFHAQYHCTAKSGIGIMVSWFPLIMPEMYNRLDPTDPASRWDFSRYIPDLVVVNLLQNDYWITSLPANPEFKHRFGTVKPDSSFIIASYRKFIARIRACYPAAKIICMLGSMNIMEKNSPWKGYVSTAVSELHDRKIFTFFAPYKNTPGHPKTAEQKQLAEELIAFIRQTIKW